MSGQPGSPVLVDVKVLEEVVEAATVVLVKTLNKRKLEEAEVALRTATREGVQAAAVARWEARLPMEGVRVGGGGE